MTYIQLLIICTTFFGCKKADIAGISNLNGNKISVLGHGGMGVASSYPMDSYESLTEAISIGADGTEMDVQMTSDAVLVGFHNKEMDKNTSCVGKINDHTWAELQECEYVSGIHGLPKIVRIDELLRKWNINDDRIVVFDCKLVTNSNIDVFQAAFANQLIDMIESLGLTNNVLIESQNIEFLQLIQAIKPGYKLFIYPTSFESGLSLAVANNLYGITISSAQATDSQIQEAHNRGLRVALWNIDTRGENVKAINKSPDYIQSDRLKNLVRLLK